MDTLNFNFVFLGQSVLKYQVPLDIYQIINHVYETKFSQLPPANKQLVGKIQNEHSLFLMGKKIKKRIIIIFLHTDVLVCLKKQFIHYQT